MVTSNTPVLAPEVNSLNPRYNVRVQAYTNPLWLGVLAAGRMASGELYYTSILLSIALSSGALIIMARHLRQRTAALAFGLIALIRSRAFVDYSTSGLD